MSMWNLLSNWFGSWLQADASRCDSVPNLPGIGIDYGDCTSGESARDDSYSGFSGWGDDFSSASGFDWDRHI